MDVILDVMVNTHQTVSELKARRLAAGVSQERVSRGAECSLGSVRLAEKGFGSPEMLARIERALADLEGVNA
jgi:transcriptional regulator with XRE-family HTH domain